jgi:hypothetical protein
LNFSDGDHSLLDIAERSGLPFSTISAAAELLQQQGLLSIVWNPDREEEPSRASDSEKPQVLCEPAVSGGATALD